MTSQQSQSKQAIAKFSTEPEAQEAQSALEAAGFARSQISIETQAIDPKPSQKDSRARKSSFGAAIAGAVLGSGAGLFISVGATSSSGIGPDVSSHPGTFTMLVATAGGLIGALAFSIIGALSGGTAPKATVADSESLSTRYLVVVRGTEQEVVRAKEVLRQQGAQI
ncbi:MAG: hypothetical protein ACFB4I_06515 [Cyanophyceae cyanobacterium]